MLFGSDNSRRYVTVTHKSPNETYLNDNNTTTLQTVTIKYRLWRAFFWAKISGPFTRFRAGAVPHEKKVFDITKIAIVPKTALKTN